MKATRFLYRILAGAIIVWSIGVVIYHLAFAKVFFQGIWVSAGAGESPTTSVFSGERSWISSVEPISVAILGGFGALLVAGGRAAWRGSFLPTSVVALLTLAGSYITGFSIGGFFFPAAAGLTLCAALIGVGRLSSLPPDRAS
jgi:hypothetical protein